VRQKGDTMEYFSMHNTTTQRAQLPLPHSLSTLPSALNSSDARAYGGLAGYSVQPHRFVVHETQAQICNAALMSLYFGYSVALIVRGFLSVEEAQALSTGFEQACTSVRTDGVPAQGLGASHYDKSTEGYFNEVQLRMPSLNQAYAQSCVDLPARLQEALQAALDPGLVLRAASWNGLHAPALRAAAWTNKSGRYALLPHDDLQQLRLPEQRGFEVQDVLGPVAANVYTSMPDVGGLLRLWNMQPLPHTKRLLGLERTGYPYPEALLDGVAYMDIQPRVGDLVLLNGAFVHAVTGWSGSTQARQVWNGFSGLLKDKSAALYWT
jgi:hypothetical protein